MPVSRPAAVVPTFGDWDLADNNDVSYTLLFEKIKATKNVNPLKTQDFHKASKISNKRHPEGKDCTFYPQLECKKNKNITSPATVEDIRDTWGKAHDLHSFSRRKPSVEQNADTILAESQYAAYNNPHVILHRSSSNGNSSQGRHCRDKHYSGISNVSHGIANNQAHQGKLRGNFSSAVTKSPARNGKVFSAASPTTHTYKQHSSLQTRNMSSEMTSNRILPTFGNWDAIDPDKVEFTLLFEKARNEKEKSSSVSKDFTKRGVAPRVDEDLYEPAYTQKRHTGFWTLLCCSKA